MKSVYDVQKQLLMEIDKICRKNKYPYFLIGYSALNAYKNKTMEDGPWTLSIAMVQGEAEQLLKELQRQDNSLRYVEWLMNNPQYSENHFTYGATDTTSIRLGKEDKMQNHGIHINVYYIDAYSTADGNRIPAKPQSYKIVRKLFKGINELDEKNKKHCNLLKSFAKSMVYGTVDVLASEKIVKKMHDERYKIRGIDVWDDLKQYREIMINGKVIPVAWISKIQEFLLNDSSIVYLPNEIEQYLTAIVGEDWQEKSCKHLLENIISSERPFTESIQLLEESGIEERYMDCVDRIKMERRKVEKECANIKSLKQLVLMTRDQVHYERIFGQCEENNMVDEEVLAQLVMSLKKHVKNNMTFRLSEDAEKAVDLYLRKIGENELLDRIQELRAIKIYAGK